MLYESRSVSSPPFDISEVHPAALFAQLAALALDNAQLHEALLQESINDQLTGLFNKRLMEETLKKEVSKTRRKSSSLVLDTVQLRMEEFRNEVKQITFHFESKIKSSITISVGIAQYPTHGVTEKELLKAADQALYQAKQAGCDQVIIAYQ